MAAVATRHRVRRTREQHAYLGGEAEAAFAALGYAAIADVQNRLPSVGFA
jgi:hypothetical protein